MKTQQIVRRPPRLSQFDGLILSGRDANDERRLSALHPAFHNAFCKSKNLSAWAKVGAVPCTRQGMSHKSVRSEVARDDTVILIE
jgi:hypothetical protein